MRRINGIVSATGDRARLPCAVLWVVGRGLTQVTLHTGTSLKRVTGAISCTPFPFGNKSGVVVILFGLMSDAIDFISIPVRPAEEYLLDLKMY
jgi:hypothetical protein